MQSAHVQYAPLSPAELALFDGGVTWRLLFSLLRVNGRKDRGSRATRLTYVVGDAEDAGLLWWEKKGKRWHLTDAGREVVRLAKKGAA